MKKLQNGFYINEDLLDEKKNKKRNKNGLDIKFVPDHGTALKYLNKNLANDSSMDVGSAAAAGGDGGSSTGGGMGENLKEDKKLLLEDRTSDAYISVKLSANGITGDKFYELPNSQIREDFCDDNGLEYDDLEDLKVVEYDTNLDYLDDHPEEYDLDELNEIADDILTNSNYNMSVEAIENVTEAEGDLKSAVDALARDNAYYYSGLHSYADIGEYVVDNYYGGIDGLPQEILEYYFDYEDLGRDLDMDTYYKDADEDDLSASLGGDDDDFVEEDKEVECNAGEYFCGDPDASYSDIGEEYVNAVGFDGVYNPGQYFDYDAFGTSMDWYLTSDGAVELL